MSEQRYELTVKNKNYVDVSLAFTPSPVTNDITLLTNERAINNALKNIVMTLPNEVTFFRNFGSRVNAYLFDMIDDATASMLEDEIKRAILFCEPRVTFDAFNENVSYDSRPKRGLQNQVNLYDDDLGVFVRANVDANEYTVTIKYRIVGGEKVFSVEQILTPTR